MASAHRWVTFKVVFEIYLSCSCSGGCVRRMAPIRRVLVEDPKYWWILLSTISITTSIIVLSRSACPGLQACRNFIVCGACICVVVVTPPIWSFQRLPPIFMSESKTVRTSFCNKILSGRASSTLRLFVQANLACWRGAYMSLLGLPSGTQIRI